MVSIIFTIISMISQPRSNINIDYAIKCRKWQCEGDKVDLAALDNEISMIHNNR